MASSTPTRAWPYPEENENPYWTNFVAFATAADADVNALYTAPTKIPYSIMDAAGDLIVGSGVDTAVRLPKGADTHLLTMTGGAVGWAAPAVQTPASNSISNAMLRDSAAHSVIGRAGTGTGDPADIAAATVGHVLRLGAGPTLAFGAVDLADTDAVTGVLPAANHDGIPKSLLTTQGDLVARDASAVVRLAGGSQGTVLTRDTGTATGLGWYRSQGWRGSLVANSTSLSNTTTRTALDKVITIPAAMMNVVGVQLVWSIRLGFGAKAAPAGGVTVDVFLNAVTRLGYVVVPVVATPAFFGGRMTIRTIGASATCMVSPGILTQSNIATAYPGITFDAGISGLDTTIAQALTVNITFDTADPSNSVNLQDAEVDIEYADLTVS